MSELSKAVSKLEADNVALRQALCALVDLYVANPETPSQYVACVTPDGNIPQWDTAMRLLGLLPHPKRRASRHFPKGA